MTPNLTATSWQDRLSIANHFNMPDAQITKVFGTTAIELTTARSLVDKGLIKIAPLPEVDQLVWATKLTQSAQPTSIVSSTPFSGAQTIRTANSASSTIRKNSTSGAKRGRVGSKIVTALNAIPTTPVPVSEFLAAHAISKTVLRQSKRFLTTPIKISLKRDKNTGIEMISRVA